MCSAVWRARFVSAQAIRTVCPVMTRRASSWPRRCACHDPSGVRPDSEL